MLGADQFVLPEQAHLQESFFNFFYWCINIGATGAFLFLSNVALYGLGDLKPESRVAVMVDVESGVSEFLKVHTKVKRYSP